VAGTEVSRGVPATERPAQAASRTSSSAVETLRFGLDPILDGVAKIAGPRGRRGR